MPGYLVRDLDIYLRDRAPWCARLDRFDKINGPTLRNVAYHNLLQIDASGRVRQHWLCGTPAVGCRWPCTRLGCKPLASIVGNTREEKTMPVVKYRGPRFVLVDTKMAFLDQNGDPRIGCLRWHFPQQTDVQSQTVQIHQASPADDCDQSSLLYVTEVWMVELNKKLYRKRLSRLESRGAHRSRRSCLLATERKATFLRKAEDGKKKASWEMGSGREDDGADYNAHHAREVLSRTKHAGLPRYSYDYHSRFY